MINSELDTIWARHNALLVANSLIIGALAISPTALWENKWAALAMLSAGLLHQRPMGRRCDGMLVLLGPLLTCFTHSQSIRRDHLQPRADPDLLPNLAGDPRFVLMYLGPGYIHLSLG